MLYNKVKPFAIKFSRENFTFQQALLYDLLENLTKKYEGFKVEGINSKKRLTKSVKRDPILEVREGGYYTQFGKLKEKTRNVIGVGLSKKYAVSFEPLEDITLSKGGCVDIYAVPVYDINKDYDTIAEKVKAYAEENFSLKACKPAKEELRVRVHSNFVRVNNNRLSFEEYELFDEVQQIIDKVKKTSKKPKKTKYSLNSVIIV